MGDANLVKPLYEDSHIIVVNKPEGMKTHGNKPTEIALLNHVSAYCGQTCYVVHRLDMETSGAVLFAKNPFILPILNRLLEDKMIQRQYWALTEGKFQTKKLFIRTRLDATATIVENGWWILEKGRVRIQPSHVSKPLKEPVWSTAN